MTTPPLDPFGRPPEAGPDDPADLAANRAGELTAGQRRRIQGQLLPGLIGGLFALLMAGGALVCFAPIIFSALWSDSEAGPLPYLFFIPFLLIWLILGAVTARPAWRAVAGLLDLNAGRVETLDGRLVWKGREYRGETERRSLPLLRGDERLPGGYRFYCLPRSGYIVSAERLFVGGADLDPAAELRRALGDVFDFRPEDLPDNQTGRLSGRQVTAQWWQMGRGALLSGAFLVPFLVVFGGIMPYVLVGRDLLAGERVDASAWLPALCAPAFLLIFVVVIGASWLNRFRDLLQGEVHAVEGEVQERTISTGSGRSRRTNYYYEVDGQRYRVTAAALQAMVSGRRYRLFVLPRSKHVVGVEPLWI